MISVGANITNNTVALQKVTVKYVFDSIRNPRPAIASQIRQLRIIRELDGKQYAQLKRQLPYFVCPCSVLPTERPTISLTRNISFLT